MYQMHENLRKAIKLLKDYCINTPCIDCPLKYVLCRTHVLAPLEYSLDQLDENVQEINENE